MQTREEAVNEGMEAMRGAEMEALGKAYDAGDQAGYERGKAEVNGEDTTPFDQAYVDEKVAEATAALEAKVTELELEEEADKELKNAVAAELEALAAKFRPASPSEEPQV